MAASALSRTGSKHIRLLLSLPTVFHLAVIDSREKLLDYLPRLRSADRIALDTEADSLHAYPAKLCLLQVTVGDEDVLVDPLASFGIGPLLEELARGRLILHGADYDLRMLYRAYSFIPGEVFDTMLAARLLGHEQFSLTHLVGSLLGVHLEKGPQTADWARRPLTERMEKYARNDTRHLVALADLLRNGLEQKGRVGWHREMCARLIQDCAQVSQPDPNQVWRVKGSNKLERRGLAVVRELWRWREGEALNAGKPPYFILAHEVIIAIATASVQTGSWSELLPRRFSEARSEGVAAAVRTALALPPAELPLFNQFEVDRLTEREKREVETLKQRRDLQAAGLGIDPTLIASRATLTDLARDWSRHEGGLMNWQRELLKS